ncbi:MAG: hypothetical protein R6U32_07030, partial [Candidatus Woesearchaeota archaeon]
MDKIRWCIEQKKGISLVEPNERTASEYIKEAETDLGDLGKSSLKWKNIVGYYACYNALYAVLQKTGLKSEIHDCTIALMDTLGLGKHKGFMSSLKKNRIDVQYYLQKPEPVDEKKVTDFVLECRNLLNNIT